MEVTLTPETASKIDVETLKSILMDTSILNVYHIYERFENPDNVDVDDSLAHRLKTVSYDVITERVDRPDAITECSVGDYLLVITEDSGGVIGKVEKVDEDILFYELSLSCLGREANITYRVQRGTVVSIGTDSPMKKITDAELLDDFDGEDTEKIHNVQINIPVPRR